MGPVFSTRLTILPDEEHPESTLHDRVIEVCHKWLKYLGGRYGVTLATSVSEDVDVTSELESARITCVHLTLDGDNAWRAIMLHPYQPEGEDGNNLQMRVELQARSDHGEEVLTIRVLIGSPIDRIRPFTFHFKTPRLVKDVLREFPHVSCGNVRATLQPRLLEGQEVRDLVREILRPDRSAPLIVISRTDEERLLCDPEAIASWSAGLARVYVLPTFASAYELTDRLNHELSCYGGAVRIYWPEFGIEDDPFQHHLWTPQRLNHDGLGGRLPGMIFNRLAQASAIGIGSDIQAWNLYHSVQEAKTRAILDRIASKEKDADDAAQLWLDAATQLKALQTGIAQKDDAIRTKDFQIASLTASLSTSSHPATPFDPLRLVREAVEMHTVADAVRLTDKVTDRAWLVILPEAYESAKESSFAGGPTPVFLTLATISRVAQRYHAGEQMGYKALFEDEGEPGYKANVSDTARKQFASDYQRRYDVDGRRTMIMLGPHLDIGSGNPHTSISIYWYVDEIMRRFVIGHVGRHLRGKQAT